MKLKTLKDLEQHMCEDFYQKGLWHQTVLKKELKAEAIKWVKDFELSVSLLLGIVIVNLDYMRRLHNRHRENDRLEF